MVCLQSTLEVARFPERSLIIGSKLFDTNSHQDGFNRCPLPSEADCFRGTLLPFARWRSNPAAMDYLPQPSNAQNLIPEVPYLCGSEETRRFQYDNQGWPGYPARMGFDADDLFYGDCPKNGCHSVNEASALLQSWLFFGLLREFFSHPFNQSSFVATNEQGNEIVDMVLLKGLIPNWIERIRRSSASANQQVLIKLNETSRNISSYISPRSSQLINGATSLPYEVVLSVLLLTNYLDIVKCHVQTQLEGYVRIPTMIPNSMTAKLIGDGWCPADIGFLQGKMQLTATYYLSLMGPPYPDLQHTQCGDQSCSAIKLQAQSYSYRHIPSNCTCNSWLEMDTAVLTRAISCDTTPLVTVTTTLAGPQLFPIVATPGKRYVAISHVWWQGLGNPDRNAVLACQGTHIQSLVNSIYSQKTNVPFWLDTLAIPRDGELRSRAIQNMKTHYDNADKVLVLETSLLHASCRSSEFEIGARLAMSAWLRRVWTFQEGVKAKDLYFQFSDGALSLHQILQKVDTCQSNEVFRPEQTLLHEFLRPFIDMKELAESASQPESTVDRLPLAFDGVSFRETKNPDDVSRAVRSVIGQQRQLPVIANNIRPPPYSTTPPPLPPRTPVRPRAAEPTGRESVSTLLGTAVGLMAGYAVRRIARHMQDSQRQTTAQVVPAAAANPTRSQSSSIPASPFYGIHHPRTVSVPATRPQANLNAVQRLLLDQETVASNMLFQEGPKLSDPGWRWCPRDIPQRAALGAYGIASANRCKVTQEGLRGTFNTIRIRPLPGATLNHSFNLYDEMTGSVYAVADCVASDRGTGNFLSRTAFEFGRAQSNWLDSIGKPALLLHAELIKGRTENAVAVLVDVVDETSVPYKATYLRRAAVIFMDDGTAGSYRNTASKCGGWENLQQQMPEWLRLGRSETREWLVG